jgi:hypothetical protein
MKPRLSTISLYSSLLSLCVVVTGCFPYHYTTRMGFSGTVVDADTFAPLAGARITLLGSTNETTVAFSAPDGSFVVPPKKKWGIWIIPQDYFGWKWIGGTACIQHVDYETNCIKFSAMDEATHRIRMKAMFGVLPLKPLR